MTAFLAELGKQLVTRWTATLMVPGALFAGAVVLAQILGHRHAVDRRVLESWLDTIAADPTGGRNATLLIAAAGFLLGAAAAGLLAGAVGLLVEWSWGLTGSAPVLRWLAGSRRRRWAAADAEVAEAERALLADPADPATRDRTRRAIARRAAIGLVAAERPTWIGDRLHAVDVRVHHSYAIDLATVWPRLWLVLPEAVRGEVTAVQDRCASAARLTGWGLLYVLLGALWWPALVVGMVALFTARYRARLAVGVYTELVEAAVDIYGRRLATQLGLPGQGRLTAETGAEISAIVRKDDVVRQLRPLSPAGSPPPADADAVAQLTDMSRRT
ncbi:hypothetical protein GCM10022225_37890 [Plantactinospora mayteni]|uniref:Vegetative cell wall protein gp1 n=1 Tax=Plantactinospora mayteni TaxID=566021 RepID=A0ABQ4F4E3_9ACTN|nr:hypothetical protein [Plantactinospora mayteni]GIH01742.1 hypothetical protein Pma05_83140 [Plantactinospora mayteni]